MIHNPEAAPTTWQELLAFQTDPITTTNIGHLHALGEEENRSIQEALARQQSYQVPIPPEARMSMHPLDQS